jgi:hypothetical protein
MPSAPSARAAPAPPPARLHVGGVRVAPQRPRLLLRLDRAARDGAARDGDVAHATGGKRGAAPRCIDPAERAAGHVWRRGRGGALAAARLAAAARARRPVRRSQRRQRRDRGVRRRRRVGGAGRRPRRARAARAAEERAAQPAAGGVAQEMHLVCARRLARAVHRVRHLREVP